MEKEELLSLVLDCAETFKTRQHIWQRCISQIKDGDACLEFGVWRGTSINYFAHARPDSKFHGFDSFDGLPQDWIKGRPRGHFKIDKNTLRFAPNVQIHAGLFDATIPKFLKQGATPSFIHIDCDLGSSTDVIFRLLGETIIKQRCLLLFDEFYNYEGYQDHELASFLRFVNATRAPFQVVGRNINHQQVLIQM